MAGICVQFRPRHLLLLKNYAVCYQRMLSNLPIIEKKGKDIPSLSEFPEQRVKIETCGVLYGMWKLKRRFWKVPSGNLTFNVRYIDTLVTEDKSSKVTPDSPVVLALHGAPGSYVDFAHQISFLGKHGIRVIAPCFPDFSVYPPGVFRYTYEEKTQYLIDFLEEINVTSIDCLLSHSASTYPALELCFHNYKPRVNSLALVNPGPYEGRLAILQPWHLMKTLVSLAENPVALGIFKIIAPPIMQLLKVPVATEEFMAPLLSLTNMVNSGFKRARENIDELHKRKFPIYLAFSDDDKLVPGPLTYRTAYRLGLHDCDVTNIDADGNIMHEGRTVHNVTAKAFLTGSHYVFKKYPDIINKDLLAFLRKYTTYEVQTLDTESKRLLRA